MSTTTQNNPNHQKEGGVVFHTAEKLEAKREQQIADQHLHEEKAKVQQSELPMGERLTAAGNVVLEAGKEAYEVFRQATESALASTQSSKAREKLDSLEREPDVRSTDEITFQHDSSPKDINPEKKGHSKLIENRKQAIESSRKATAEEIKKDEFKHNKENAKSTKDRLAEGYKEKVSIVHQQTHKATAAVHNHKADVEAKELYGKQPEIVNHEERVQN